MGDIAIREICSRIFMCKCRAVRRTSVVGFHLPHYTILVFAAIECTRVGIVGTLVMLKA